MNLAVLASAVANGLGEEIWGEGYATTAREASPYAPSPTRGRGMG